MARKTARDVIKETSVNEIGLALLYIETERQLFIHINKKNNVEAARAEGIMEGILKAAKMLGVEHLYSKTITDLRYSIQEENKELRK